MSDFSFIYFSYLQVNLVFLTHQTRIDNLFLIVKDSPLLLIIQIPPFLQLCTNVQKLDSKISNRIP